MRVVVAHIKGGTGKTTTAVQLALYRAIKYPKRKIWLIDTDEQQSALDTISIRSDLGHKPDLPCSAYTSPKALVSQFNAQGEFYNDIIIDAGGRDTDALRVSLLGCDVLLVPVLPRAYDIWALSRLEAVIESAKNLGADFKSYAFINRVDKSADCRQTRELLKQSETFELLDVGLSDRITYAKAGGLGRSVLEMKPKSIKACEEIATLSHMVFGD